MGQGAYSVHKEIRKELENYIKTQYFGKSPLLFSALRDELTKEGVLYREPYIESLPAYKQAMTGFENADLEEWLKSLFTDLIKDGLGVFATPFIHQKEALELFSKGEDIFVSTGTGSGKTECFMWPLVAKLAKEAKFSDSWSQRGVRVMIMYPMNALVSDQLSRLRNLLGDANGDFIRDFRKCAGKQVRRPTFGMYTGRTPYSGPKPRRENDKRLADTFSKMLMPDGSDSQAIDYYNTLLKEGRIPAKVDLNAFVERLRNGEHVPHDEDAELLTRFEMQKYCPDILITNYSMLEYMLFRPREAQIWDDTKKWLRADQNNKLLFVIDEAHMYRGSSGGEVALLIRRLLHKLEIGVDRVQFILTTASMPNKSEDDRKAVMAFAHNLTGKNNFHYLVGEREVLNSTNTKPLVYVEPTAKIIERIEATETCLEGLNDYWKNATNGEISFNDLKTAQVWLYDHLAQYEPFNKLISACRGSAVSIRDLAKDIYPNVSEIEGVNAVSLLISVAQLARDNKGTVLFPAKMHLLFRGLKGVYACTNPDCKHSNSNDGIKLGKILIEENNYICPDCGSAVYELYQDRRCGALFYKGYIVEDEKNKGRAYLWHYPGQLLDRAMFELHLFIPPDDFVAPRVRSGNQIKPCYMNIRNGFIDFRDDRHKHDSNYRKLYYSEYIAKDVPNLMTFTACPHCQKSMSRLRLSGFATKGNQSFNNLIKAQFNSEDPVANRLKDPFKYPNEGRKVLMFSDSRQRAATLARDMTSEANIAAARQLFMAAFAEMSKQENELSLDESYGFFLHEAIKNNVPAFDSKFRDDCDRIREGERRNKRRSSRRQRPVDLSQYTLSNNAGEVIQEQLMRLYCGNYNTLVQDALSWIEPIDATFDDLIDDIADELDISIDSADECEELERKVLEVFSAWFTDICDTNQAVGPTISNIVRNRVRKNYKEGFGLKSDWTFSTVIKQANGWTDDSREMSVFHKAFQRHFLESSNSEDAYFVKLNKIKPKYEPAHQWFRCTKCSEISPFRLQGKCPSCGSENIKQMAKEDYDALAFWREPAKDAIDGKRVRVIDTEEHTAQLSHKDQQDDMWSKTEEYEMRFQDIIKEDETPVDILSSTTTMEVGIDIGSLVAVGLRNIPPMRENYQQRAGRAGRRGSALSTIVTFCENGPYDTLYFKNPTGMFSGEPRRPWIDTNSKKLLMRHLNILLLQSFVSDNHGVGLDEFSTESFIEDFRNGLFTHYLTEFEFRDAEMLLGPNNLSVLNEYKKALEDGIIKLESKYNEHPELYVHSDITSEKTILDALYEEGIIPTYSFPKDVISLYINKYRNSRPKIEYQVERGLNISIGEYAPGRSVVVDKNTYQIGGLYYPGSEIRNPQSPVSSFINDPNYNKKVISCRACGWFDIQRRDVSKCPFCGNPDLNHELPMIKPWGFAPKDGRAYSDAQIDEEYSAVKEPLYSTLPTAEEMETVADFINIRKASRSDQSIIIMNKGPADTGFTLCPDCGAIMPAEKTDPLKKVYRPYKINGVDNRCPHSNSFDVNLGYEMKTDMLVLEFKLDKKSINTGMHNNLWLVRAGASLSEAIRLVAGEKLDIEFTELVTGFRIRDGQDYAYVDVYIYDSLSSGAGYSEHLSSFIDELLIDTLDMLEDCSCDSACYDCLKHYRNQHLHGKLNRHAAADLLKWGMHNTLPQDYTLNEQWNLLYPVVNVLEEYRLRIAQRDDCICISSDNEEKEIVVYPAMRKAPASTRRIYISDYMLKYARPTAVECILNCINPK